MVRRPSTWRVHKHVVGFKFDNKAPGLRPATRLPTTQSSFTSVLPTSPAHQRHTKRPKPRPVDLTEQRASWIGNAFASALPSSPPQVTLPPSPKWYRPGQKPPLRPHHPMCVPPSQLAPISPLAQMAPRPVPSWREQSSQPTPALFWSIGAASPIHPAWR